jgi:hypothetical protein
MSCLDSDYSLLSMDPRPKHIEIVTVHPSIHVFRQQIPFEHVLVSNCFNWWRQGWMQ